MPFLVIGGMATSTIDPIVNPVSNLLYLLVLVPANA